MDSNRVGAARRGSRVTCVSLPSSLSSEENRQADRLPSRRDEDGRLILNDDYARRGVFESDDRPSPPIC